ncbi:helix-turn-helix domain-containing protein [Actinoallomurus acaciae]|uniref:Helix-turn-helix domain-containing protein n=1 Tax=Actinoallomurus acaciae TaxID=502577 RepID=A0ABV5YCJ4_9ACTN
MTFGEYMRALMAEREISLRKLAGALPANVGYLSKISRDLQRPSEEMARRVDNALGAGGALAAFVRPDRGTVPTVRMPTPTQFAHWIESTNTGPSTIAFFEQETRRIAVDYASRAPMEVLADTSALLGEVTGLLQDGRQRLTQTSALFCTASELFAVQCLLAGDIGRYGPARAYGHTAWLCAEEADSDLHRALARSAQSKTAKWEQRYGEAAAFARQGYECSPPIEARILLASQEANALQSLGDLAGAEEALFRARQARDELPPGADLGSAWACPRPRQATYALQVAIGAYDPAWVLREVQAADDAWSEGDLWVYGTWSQVRVGAGIAHAMAGEVDGAAEEVAPVLELPPELRVVTIAGRLGVVERQLAQRRYAGSGAANNLREQIKDFRAGALHRRALTPQEDG